MSIQNINIQNTQLDNVNNQLAVKQQEITNTFNALQGVLIGRTVFKLDPNNADEALSEDNIAVLQNHANKIYKERLSDFFEQKAVYQPNALSKTVSYIGSFLPSVKTAGEKAGQAFAQTYGQEIAGQTVELAVNYLIPDAIKAEELAMANAGYLERMGRWATGNVVVPGIIEGAKVAAVPYMVPVLEYGAVMAGGAGLVVAFEASKFLYKKSFGTLSPDQIGNLEGNGKIVVKNNTITLAGKTISNQALRSVISRISEYELCKTISSLKKGEVKNFFKQYIVTREDGKKFFQNGKAVTQKELAAIKQAKKWLQDQDNPMKEEADIVKTIKLFANNFFDISTGFKDFDGQWVVKCDDGQYCYLPQMDKEKKWPKAVILTDISLDEEGRVKRSVNVKVQDSKPKIIEIEDENEISIEDFVHINSEPTEV